MGHRPACRPPRSNPLAIRRLQAAKRGHLVALARALELLHAMRASLLASAAVRHYDGGAWRQLPASFFPFLRRRRVCQREPALHPFDCRTGAYVEPIGCVAPRRA